MVSTLRPDDLFDFSRLDKTKKPEPAPPPVRRRRVIRDKEALRSVRPAPTAPIDVDAQVVAARSAVRERTSRALESLGVVADAAPASIPAVPERPLRWRLLVRAGEEHLEFYVPGSDLLDAVQGATPGVARWMRERGVAGWRVEAVEDLAHALI